MTPTPRSWALALSAALSMIGLGLLWRLGPVIWRLKETVGSDEPLVAQCCYLVSMLFSAVPVALALSPALVLWLWRHTPHEMRRRDRVRAVAARADAVARAPHRIIEALWHRPRIWGFNSLALSHLRPGQVVPISTARNGAWVVRPAAHPFEPLGLTDHDDAVQRLKQMAGEDEQDSSLRTRRHRRSVQWTRARIVCWALFLVAAGWGFWTGIRLIRQFPRGPTPPRPVQVGTWYPSSREMLIFSLGGAAFIAPFAAAQFARTTWYVVPGGLVRRRYRVWRTADDIRLFTRANAPIVLDGVFVMLGGKQPIAIKCNWPMARRILAGWLSDARTPTLEELRSYFSAERAETHGRHAAG